MADTYPTQDVDGQDSPLADGNAPLGTALNVLGAAASLALIVGIGVWGYKLVMRDVSGVPVVRAVEGPMRIQPEDPGGLPADHQGLAVNAVAAKGTAEAPAERLVLAPRPVDLADEDQPVQKQNPITASLTPQARGTTADEDVAQATPDAVSQDAVDEFKAGSVQSLVDQLIAGVMPAPEEQPDTTIVQATARIEQPAPLVPETGETATEDADPAPEEEAKVVPAVVTGPGLARSLRPRTRPAVAVQPAGAAAAEPVKAALDVDPDSLPAGTRLAQLGAFESPEVAKQEWDRLSGKFGDHLEGKSRVIQKASSGGRTFYRLRVMGFDDLSDARRFCSMLVAEKADCIPVTIR